VGGCAGADVGASSMAAGASLTDMNPVNFVYAEVGPESATAGPFKAFAEEVKVASGGKITFEPYFGGSLVPANEGLSAVQNGTADMAFVSAAWVPQDLPVANWVGQLTALSSGAYPLSALQGPAGALDVALSSPAMRAEYDAAGVKLLWASAVNTRSGVMCKDAISSLADARGKRVAVSGKSNEKEASAIGMVPINLSVLEWYEGLQRGVVDCVATTPAGAMGYGVWEVAKHWNYLDFLGSGASSVVANKDKFEGMPVEAQQIIWDALDTWVAERIRLSTGDYARMATEGQKKHGVQFHTPDPALKGAIQAEQERRLSELIATPPPGLSDPRAFVDMTGKIWSKWEKLISEEFDMPTVTEGDRTQSEIDHSQLDVPKMAALLERNAYGQHRP
jgi:TRAP-type C4-dicarboxylate transport system substrate-binding protein